MESPPSFLTTLRSLIGRKVDLAECKYCKDSTTKPPFKKAWNTTRCHDHLKVCVPYIDHIDERNAPTRSRAERLQEEGSNNQAKKPNKLNFKPIDDTWLGGSRLSEPPQVGFGSHFTLIKPKMKWGTKGWNSFHM